MILPSIETPADLKGLNEEQLAQLCEEIRAFIVDTVHEDRGAPRLEPRRGRADAGPAPGLRLAPRRLLLDTGHQAYVHKLLTGRRYGFKDLKQRGGMSGYPNRAESEHDWIESSHASTALSYAHGLANGVRAARRVRPRRTAGWWPSSGDGALTGGMAYEALNNLGPLRQARASSSSTTTGAATRRPSRSCREPHEPAAQPDLHPGARAAAPTSCAIPALGELAYVGRALGDRGASRDGGPAHFFEDARGALRRAHRRPRHRRSWSRPSPTPPSGTGRSWSTC